ncbi:MAG: DNA-binding protein WhiA [bacterium]|nr:DNA-binding protein WhiA [bacterium]MCM1374553.1 DNA-binding protein WhiA [Muribaculum sp.]
MSFSREVKEELTGLFGAADHCRKAELAAMISLCGQYGRDSDGLYTIGFQVENEIVLRKCFTLLEKTYNIEKNAGMTEEEMQVFYHNFGSLQGIVDSRFLKKSCCRRAFLRGAFLCAGSISDPSKGYHLELVCNEEAKAGQLRQLIQEFGIEAKIVVRKKYYVVYIKEGAGIVDLLNVMGAHKSLMNLENLRILKEMRNSINRRVNCETANITKTVNAANRQIEDILYLRDHYGLQKLPPALRNMAEVRLEYPDASLKELGEHLEPPVGKSGVNHRLRKLSELAQQVNK